MLGLTGPVFDYERVAASRRGRYYAIRAAHGLVLLGLVGSKYWSYFGRVAAAVAPPHGPVLAGGVPLGDVAPARRRAGPDAGPGRRGNLRRAGPQDADGPAGHPARLGRDRGEQAGGADAPVSAGLALSLPILAFLGLFGGVDPAKAALGTLAILACGFLVASFAILVSTVSRQSRDAVSLSYLATAAWFFGPELARGWMAAHLGPAIPWVESATPLEYHRTAHGAGVAGLPGLAWSAAVQFGIGSHSPGVDRRAPSDVPPRGRPGARVNGFGRARPAPIRAGRRPMLWKELRFGRPRGVAAAAFRVAVTVGMAYLLFRTAAAASASFSAVGRSGYGWTTRGDVQDSLNTSLRIALGIASMAWPPRWPPRRRGRSPASATARRGRA